MQRMAAIAEWHDLRQLVTPLHRAFGQRLQQYAAQLAALDFRPAASAIVTLRERQLAVLVEHACGQAPW
jgi:hypothetical protein